MANVYADRVQETSTTTGTGTYDLAGATTGYQTFVAGAGDASTVTYVADDGTDWEVGVGTVTDAATDTLSRDSIIASSNSGSAVSWTAGTRTISLTYTSQLIADVIRVAVINETQTANTSGGTFTSGAWQTRTLNTNQSDVHSIITSLSSNQFTLESGTYLIKAYAPGHRVGRHKAKLRNITDSTDDLIGSSEFSDSSADEATTRSIVSGIITIASQKAFEIQHRCETTKTTNGFGIESNFGVSEVYTQVEIIRLA